MSGEVTTACIPFVCLLNRTDNCFMDAMVEYPFCENGALGSGFCKACESFFDDSVALSKHNGKVMVKLCGKNSTVSAM